MGHWLAADSNKDLYIGENDVKKVETTWATMIQWFNSSLFFADEDIQAAFWLHILLTTIKHVIFLALASHELMNCKQVDNSLSKNQVPIS